MAQFKFIVMLVCNAFLVLLINSTFSIFLFYNIFHNWWYKLL